MNRTIVATSALAAPSPLVGLVGRTPPTALTRGMEASDAPRPFGGCVMERPTDAAWVCRGGFSTQTCSEAKRLGVGHVRCGWYVPYVPALPADVARPDGDDRYDEMLAVARQGCCDDRRKPCERHDAYADGLEQGLAARPAPTPVGTGDAVALLASLVDPGECWFDHHGGCQAHGFLDLGPGEVCPNEAARRLVASAAAPSTPTPPEPGDEPGLCESCRGDGIDPANPAANRCTICSGTGLTPPPWS